ncbi:hypothetical protein DL89DRAFT_264501 [Linderina pennispora]|uniref:Mitochondrial cytochrome c oxidase assembly factor n=1 Tax=Linderina pennispora TaxID=61395 RepID=A0A1Y1WM98_9FUNG|nr:uncharacterized protein DL89DRAFT_264501 [Linderina pennispora]ORX74689.1 hypothetical protein DL89DRAFT_264501 [Linderina pennispora]
MGGPGLEVAKFTFYVFMPMAFMVYFGGPGFYERYVADEAFKFNPPPKMKMPTEPGDVQRALDQLRADREARRLAREQVISQMSKE